MPTLNFMRVRHSSPVIMLNDLHIIQSPHNNDTTSPSHFDNYNRMNIGETQTSFNHRFTQVERTFRLRFKAKNAYVFKNEPTLVHFTGVLSTSIPPQLH